jgi:nucleoside phosphorylase
MPTATEVEEHIAVVFTALPVEYKAVKSHLECIEEKMHPTKGTIYDQGVFTSNGRSWKVVIAEIGKGNVQVALEVERAIEFFKPSIILFVGVAGGIKSVKLGDVVVANKIYGYESGKADYDFKPRPAVCEPKYAILQRVNAEARKGDWLRRLSEKLPDQHPTVFIEPIAAGEKVLNSTQSEFYKLIKSNYEDAVAVEMEGYGFLKAAYANSQVDALVIRGISDLIDGKEAADKAGSQRIASLHASAFAFEILSKMYISTSLEQKRYSENLHPEIDVVLNNKKQKIRSGEGSSNRSPQSTLIPNETFEHYNVNRKDTQRIENEQESNMKGHSVYLAQSNEISVSKVSSSSDKYETTMQFSESKVEEWRNAFGIVAGEIYVSDQGRVKDADGKLLQMDINEEGYNTVKIDGKPIRVDYLVACAFLPCPNGYVNETAQSLEKQFGLDMAQDFNAVIVLFLGKEHRTPTVCEVKFIASDVIMQHFDIEEVDKNDNS